MTHHLSTYYKVKSKNDFLGFPRNQYSGKSREELSIENVREKFMAVFNDADNDDDHNFSIFSIFLILSLLMLKKLRQETSHLFSIFLAPLVFDFDVFSCKKNSGRPFIIFAFLFKFSWYEFKMDFGL
jgi:hypothetical protein